MEHDILNEQIAYYRARAQEYDESVREGGEPSETFARVTHLLRQMGPFEQVLELACGTGIWTKFLLQIGRAITAIDAAPEVIEIAQRKVGNAPVHFQCADLFQWEPVQEYDLVFFGFWLSHVPPERLSPFLERISRAVRPGGYVVIIDQYAPTEEDRQIIKEGEVGALYAERPLRDGRTFTIVKVFYDVITLQEKFTNLGFESVVHKLDDSYFFFSARRKIPRDIMTS